VLLLYWAPSKIVAVWSHNHKAMIQAQSSHFEKLTRTELCIYGPRARRVYEIGTSTRRISIFSFIYGHSSFKSIYHKTYFCVMRSFSQGRSQLLRLLLCVDLTLMVNHPYLADPEFYSSERRPIVNRNSSSSCQPFTVVCLWLPWQHLGQAFGYSGQFLTLRWFLWGWSGKTGYVPSSGDSRQ